MCVVKSFYFHTLHHRNEMGVETWREGPCRRRRAIMTGVNIWMCFENTLLFSVMRAVAAEATLKSWLSWPGIPEQLPSPLLSESTFLALTTLFSFSHIFLVDTSWTSYSEVRTKNRFCRTIWLAFVCAHARSYIWLRHENVSGSFQTQSCFRNVLTRHELPCVMKVVTHSLTRFLLVYDTYRHMRTKRHVVIWAFVRTQETKRDLRRKSFSGGKKKQSTLQTVFMMILTVYFSYRFTVKHLLSLMSCRRNQFRFLHTTCLVNLNWGFSWDNFGKIIGHEDFDTTWSVVSTVYSFTTFHSFETSYSIFISLPRSLSSMFCKRYMVGVFFRALSGIILIIVWVWHFLPSVLPFFIRM